MQELQPLFDMVNKEPAITGVISWALLTVLGVVARFCYRRLRGPAASENGADVLEFMKAPAEMWIHEKGVISRLCYGDSNLFADLSGRVAIEEVTPSPVLTRSERRAVRRRVREIIRELDAAAHAKAVAETARKLRPAVVNDVDLTCAESSLQIAGIKKPQTQFTGSVGMPAIEVKKHSEEELRKAVGLPSVDEVNRNQKALCWVKTAIGEGFGSMQFVNGKLVWLGPSAVESMLQARYLIGELTQKLGGVRAAARAAFAIESWHVDNNGCLRATITMREDA